MNRFLNCAVLLAGTMSGSLFCQAEAQASHPSCAEYRTVIRYETRLEPYVQRVMLYDKCGRPYWAEKVYLRTVTIPVKQVVRVYR